MSYSELSEAISAFFAHPFILAIVPVLIGWYLNREKAKDK